MRKNSKNALRIGRMERIVANVNATSPTAPHCIQSCVKSNIAGSLRVLFLSSRDNEEFGQ